MAPWLAEAIGGAAAGVAASFLMDVYQSATGPLFGEGGSSDEKPATVKAADTAREAVGAGPVPRRSWYTAGDIVHYSLGTTLGVFYALLVLRWPPAATGFGVLFGLAAALLLDNFLVPLFGWGTWPWQTGAKVQAYSLTSHIVFGVVLEGVRRVAMMVLA